MRSRTAAASLLSFALDIGTKWYHTQVDTVPDGTRSPEAINAERRGSPNRARCALSGDSAGSLNQTEKGTHMLPQLSFFGSIAFSVIAWGMVTARYI